MGRVVYSGNRVISGEIPRPLRGVSSDMFLEHKWFDLLSSTLHSSRTMGNFVLPNFLISLPTRLFAKNSIIHEHSRRAVECYSNFWVRNRPRKTPPFYPLEGRSLFLPKKRLAGGEQLDGT